MHVLGTRGGPSATFLEAARQGTAQDGGLFVPATIPTVDRGFLEDLRGRSFADVATRVAEVWLRDESQLLSQVGEGGLGAIIRDAFPFEIPVSPLDDGRYMLELFHGPTMAFKDVGARFLARVLGGADRRTVLVATSGDTGGAVASAFFGVDGVDVVIVYPEGRVSPFQERQIASLGGNIHAARVAGGFDDCQRLVKDAFADQQLKSALGLTSANSINLGRLLPQVFYYFHAWAQLPSSDAPLIISVPSGNFGNLTAGLIAWRMGLPVTRFVAATNPNDAVPRYLATGKFEPRPSVPTISNAMDVGDPSNFERLSWLFEEDGIEGFRSMVSGRVYSDEETRGAISDVFERTGVVLCPHTAVGYLGLRDEMSEHQGSDPVGLVLATAHSAKFPSVVTPLVGEAPAMPESAEMPPDAPPSAPLCDPDYDSFKAYLEGLDLKVGR